jgi:hypothetical protein
MKASESYFSTTSIETLALEGGGKRNGKAS